VSLQVDYDEAAISQAAAFLSDPAGIREVLDAIDRLADDPRPPESFPYGSPDLRRLRIGQYRVLYEIIQDTVAIRHVARSHGSLSCAAPLSTGDCDATFCARRSTSSTSSPANMGSSPARP
jgi:mRNA interferase RelE/StbE